MTMLNKKHSNKTKKILREKRFGKNNPFYGKKHLPETIQKIKNWNINKHLNDFTYGFQKGNKTKTQFKKGHPTRKEIRIKMSQSRMREKNPQWKGGISFEPYPVDWTDTLKRAIRERDNYICQICSQYGSIVHHIDYNKKNCNPKNLVTLCRKCHGKTQHNRNYWIIKLNHYVKEIAQK